MSGNWDTLVNAIIYQAVADWRNAFRYIRKHSGSTSERIKDRVNMARHKKAECERFFRSEWFRTLTDLNGEVLLADLKKESIRNPILIRQDRDETIKL